MDNKHYLFVYGTLMDYEMRMTLFNREIEIISAFLKNYTLKENGDFYFISEEKGEQVEGLVLGLTEEELLICDQWEEIPYYDRKIVIANTEDDSLEVFVYTRINSEGQKVVKNTVSSLSREYVIKQIGDFKYQLNTNKLPYCDLYVLVPCIILDYENILLHCDSKSGFEIDFINRLNATSNNEFNGFLANLIRRYFLPMVEIAAFSSDDSKLIGYEKASIAISFVEFGNYAVINIIIPALSVPLLNFLDQVVSNRIRVRELKNENFIMLNDFLKSKGIIMSGVPRVSVFFKEKPQNHELLSTLVCETDSPSLISSKILRQILNENIAQYDSAEIYASNNCVVEIPKKFNNLYSIRLDNQILTLFIIELIQLQEAALKKVSDDIYTMISKKHYQNDVFALKQIEKVTEEYSKAMLLWDINCFKYRTAQILANEFSRKFEMNEKFEVFFQNKKLIEQLTQVHSNRLNISENKMLNQVLLLLAFIQIVPVIFLTAQTLLTSKLQLNDLISGLTSIISCFMIWLIFKYLYRNNTLKLK